MATLNFPSLHQSRRERRFMDRHEYHGATWAHLHRMSRLLEAIEAGELVEEDAIEAKRQSFPDRLYQAGYAYACGYQD